MKTPWHEWAAETAAEYFDGFTEDFLKKTDNELRADIDRLIKSLINEKYGADPTETETRYNMYLAVAMMATAMEKDGGFEEVLSRPAVQLSIPYARQRLSGWIGTRLQP